MTIDEVAILALQFWDRDQAILMVAIAGCESSYNERARGDPLSAYPQDWQDVYGPYSCMGYNAFGLWQVFLYWHRDKLERLTGSTDPCFWSTWLFTPENNARIAAEILDSQGLSAWSCYNTGGYRNFFDQATTAVDQALGVVVPPPPPPPPVPPTPPPPRPFIPLEQLSPVEPPFAPVEPPFAPVEPPF